MLSSFMAAFSSCSGDVSVLVFGLKKVEGKSHTKNFVGVGGVRVNGVLNASLILLDGDLALTSTAGVVVVGSDASGGLGGVLGRHVDCVVWRG